MSDIHKSRLKAHTSKMKMYYASPLHCSLKSGQRWPLSKDSYCMNIELK